MKKFTRLLLLVSTICLLVVVLTLTALFIKRVWFSGLHLKSGFVAVVDISGMIFESASIVQDIEDLVSNPGVKAIVVRVNSPGGLVGPSQEIYDAIRRCDSKIPVFISMGAVAASGGYYIALGGRKIFASPGTLTASIGVIMEFANTDKLYKWAKIDRYSLKSGKFKDLGTTTRFMTTDEKGLIDELISDIHNQFKSALRERRGLEESILERVTDGRIMTGLQAKQAKLIDEIGGLDVVIEALKKEVGLPVDAYVKYPESKHGFLWRLFFGEARERLSVNPVSDWFQRSKPIWGWRVLLLSPIQY